MTAGVITNAGKDSDYGYTHRICEFLNESNVKYTIGEDTSADFWVVLGGDGTMLRASHTAAAAGIPMIGINLGTLGYLTDVEKHDGIKAVGLVLKNEYTIENRLMLNFEIENDNPLRNGIALNDVYLSRMQGRLTTFNLYINGRFIDTFRADGVIASTPTGSTAYNLSAGGPILMPDGDMMVVTAVCPHTLHTRPWVISSRDEVRMSPAHNDVTCAVDGEERFTLRAGRSIIVKKADCFAKIIKTSISPHFYETLQKKLIK